ncbi:hypothetical protein L227DRAFT_154486 [Lentinus tigrinus ALCF2SS1-6]|uniref:Uncharacterized protein n=1 Tax=Lentinus tigrinus ALCF2SS1-6 TaxID=1328759 RepID=A0A5C2S990_9APHY|nr:hypothetical protein L227DRAFT_154486 [Lentinus tigrinus ALCF2SS1-6]
MIIYLDRKFALQDGSNSLPSRHFCAFATGLSCRSESRHAFPVAGSSITSMARGFSSRFGSVRAHQMTCICRSGHGQIQNHRVGLHDRDSAAQVK